MLGSKPNWSLTGGYKIHISSKVSPNNSGVQRLCAHPIVPIGPSSFPLFIPGHWISPRYSSWCLAAWEPCNHLDSSFSSKAQAMKGGKVSSMFSHEFHNINIVRKFGNSITKGHSYPWHFRRVRLSGGLQSVSILCKGVLWSLFFFKANLSERRLWMTPQYSEGEKCNLRFKSENTQNQLSWAKPQLPYGTEEAVMHGI